MRQAHGPGVGQAYGAPSSALSVAKTVSTAFHPKIFIIHSKSLVLLVRQWIRGRQSVRSPAAPPPFLSKDHTLCSSDKIICGSQHMPRDGHHRSSITWRSIYITITGHASASPMTRPGWWQIDAGPQSDSHVLPPRSPQPRRVYTTHRTHPARTRGCIHGPSLPCIIAQRRRAIWRYCIAAELRPCSHPHSRVLPRKSLLHPVQDWAGVAAYGTA